MKISTLQENFKNGLLTVGHIAGKNINLPILNNVLIRSEKGNIKLITTNLEMGIVSLVRGKVEKEGEFTVDSKTISDYISLLPNKKIDVEKKENKLFIQSENYKTSIKGQEADEYPLIPKVDKKNFFKVKTENFRKALSQIVFAVSTSEARAELSGVLFNFNKDTLTMVATDSYRLAEKRIKIYSNNQEEKKIIIPAKTLLEVMRILSNIRDETINQENDEIAFYISDNQVLFTMGGTELVSRIVDGQYPNYKQIIPTNSETTAIINQRELVRAVKAASIFSKFGINDINLDFPLSKNKVIISSASSQTGENITELDATVSGKDNGIVINYRYLLDGLNNVDSENVIIEITNGNTPCILKPFFSTSSADTGKEAKNKDEGYLYIIMPIKQ